MISSVAVRAHGREGGVDTPWRKESNKVKIPKKEAKRDPTTALLRSAEEENRLSPVPLQPNRKTLRSCYTFAEESSCAFPNTRCDAQAPAQIFLLGKQASRSRRRRRRRAPFTLLYMYPIPSHRNPAAEEEEGRVRNF